MTDTMTTILPFSGFYHSVHSDAMDSALEQAFWDDHGDVHDDDADLYEKAWEVIDWDQVHQACARDYTETFATMMGIEGMEFEKLDQPTAYNFATDRIFARLPKSFVMGMYETMSYGKFMHGSYSYGLPVFDKLCRERFTSYDGFASYYDPDWRKWEPIEEWDHNQVGTLLEAWCIWHGYDTGGHFDSVEGDIAYCDEYYLIVDQWCTMFPELDKVLTEAWHRREERERQG